MYNYLSYCSKSLTAGTSSSNQTNDSYAMGYNWSNGSSHNGKGGSNKSNGVLVRDITIVK